MFVSRSGADTEHIAAAFARSLRGGEVILLTGELGAGKTVFARGLARGLGIRGRITSPTFVLMRVHRAASAKLQATSAWRKHRSKCRRLAACSYQLVAWFVHVDAYRIRDPQELATVGLFEWAGRQDVVVVIEWGERVKVLIHGIPYYHITITSGPRDARRIEIIQHHQLRVTRKHLKDDAMRRAGAKSGAQRSRTT